MTKTSYVKGFSIAVFLLLTFQQGRSLTTNGIGVTESMKGSERPASALRETGPVNTAPTITTDFPALEVCGTGTILLQVEVGGSATSVTFTGGAGTYANYDDSNFPVITEEYSPAFSESGTHVIITAMTDDPDDEGPASQLIDLNVLPTPSAAISASPDIVCSGESSVLSFSFTGVPPFTFEYNVFDGVNFTPSGPVTVTPPGSGPVYVYTLPVGPFVTTSSYFLTSVSDDNVPSCGGLVVPGSDQVTITMNGGATITTDFPALDVCGTGTVVLQVQIGGGATAVTFSGGLGTYGNYDDSNYPYITQEYSPDFTESNGHVLITAVTDGGCDVASTEIDLNVLPTPSAAISAGPDIICSGESSELSISFTGVPPFTFEYNVFDGVNFTSSGPVTVTPPGSGPVYTYTLPVGPLTSSTSYFLTSVADDNIPSCGGLLVPGNDQVTISINVDATITTDFPALDVCGTGVVTLQVEVGGSATGVTFSGGLGTYGNYDDSNFPFITEEYSPDFTESGTHVLVTASTGGGCEMASIEIDLNVLPTPSAAITASPDLICSGESSELLFSFTGVPPFTFEYNVFDGVNFTSSGPVAVTPPGSGPVYVYPLPVGPFTSTTSYFLTSVSDNNIPSCGGLLVPGNDQVTISINPEATIVTDFPALDVCVNGVVTLQVEVGGSASGVAFAGGLGTYGNYDDSGFPFITVEYSPDISESGAHVIVIATTDGGCESDLIEIDLNVLPTPSAAISASPDLICSGESSDLSFTFTGVPPFTFEYNVFDGVNFTPSGPVTVTPPGSGPTYVYTLPGGPFTTTTSYSLISVSDNSIPSCNGLLVPGSDQVIITINPEATIVTDFPALDVCVNGVVTLQVEVGGSATGATFAGGLGTYGNYDDSNYPFITEEYSPDFSEFGTHVIVTATTDGGCESDFTEIDLNVLPVPSAAISASPDIICSGESSELTFTFTGVPPFTFEYNVFDGVNFTPSGPVTVTPPGSGPTYVYTLPIGPLTSTTSYSLTSVSDNNIPSCNGLLVSGSDQAIVTINADATVTTDFPALDVCASGVVTLQVGVGGSATSATFAGGLGTYSNYDDSGFPFITIEYSPDFSESGNHVIITATTDGGCGTASTDVDLNVSTDASITNNNGLDLSCTIPTTTLTASDNASYLWSTGSTTSSITVSAAGTYMVTAMALNGCTSTDEVLVSEDFAQPAVSIDAPVTTELTCLVTSISLNASGNGISYLWSNGASTAGTSVSSPSTYTVIATAANGCTNTDEIIITQDIVQPTLSIDVPVTTELSCSVTSISLNASGNGVSYLWSNGSSTAGTSVSSAGTYTVIATAANGCANDESIVITQDNTPCTTTLNLKLFIEGYYAGGGQMQPVIFYETGLNPAADETDTVIVELRTAADPTTVVEAVAGILMTDGTVNNLSFSGAIAGNNYYIAVKHRNAVQTWSATDIPFSAITDYDFSTDNSQSYGPNMVEIDAGLGIWAFYSGDIDQDEIVTGADYVPMEADIAGFASGYLYTDLDGDGIVTGADYVVMEGNLLNFVGAIHP